MHVIDVMAMVIDIVDGSDGHCYKIEAVIHVIDMMAMVMEMMEIVIGSKL